MNEDGIEVRRFEGTRDIARLDWDRMVQRGDFYSSWSWFAYLETLPGVSWLFFGAYIGGMLKAILPVSLAKYELVSRYDASVILGDDSAENGSVAVVGPRRGFRNSLIVAPGLLLELQDELIEALFVTARAQIENLGVEIMVAPYCSEPLSDRLSLVIGGTKVAAGGEAVLELPGESFEDYLDGLSSKRRQAVRRERRVAARGLHFRRPAVEEESIRALARLATATGRAYGEAISEAAVHRTLRLQAEACAESVRLFAAFDGAGECISSGMSFAWRRELFTRVIGTRQVPPDASFAYFNVAFYEAIEYSYEMSLRRIHFGIESLNTKASRGCTIFPMVHHRLDVAAGEPR